MFHNYASYFTDLHGIDLGLQHDWCVRRNVDIGFVFVPGFLIQFLWIERKYFNAATENRYLEHYSLATI